MMRVSRVALDAWAAVLRAWRGIVAGRVLT
jgi:hypothetical protein